MGRTTRWLAEQRPAMVEILEEIARSSPYTAGGTAAGDMGLLMACLARATARAGDERSITAMRQAWWRWTTDGPDAGTPPVRDLALIVRHANHRGWLAGLKSHRARALVDRLMAESDKVRAARRRAMEVAWKPTARIAVEGLVDFLEARIATLADEDGGTYWGASFPVASVVQEEVSTMLNMVVDQLLRSLTGPRDVFESSVESESLIQLFEGWPAALRRLATDISSTLRDAACECEELEDSVPLTPQGPSNQPAKGQRLPKTIGRTQAEADAQASGK